MKGEEGEQEDKRTVIRVLVRILKLRLARQVTKGTILKLSNLGSYSKYLRVYILL